jgi:hypothetical protein
MSTQKLYQIAVTYIDPKEPKNSKIVVDPTNVLANDEEHAKRLALRDARITEEWNEKLADLKVDIRPF